MGMGRIAARSLPGALLVSGGMLGKIMFDRAMAHRHARAAADQSGGDGTKPVAPGKQGKR